MDIFALCFQVTSSKPDERNGTWAKNIVCKQGKEDKRRNQFSSVALSQK